MDIAQCQAEIASLYRTARELVMKSNPIDAREHVLMFVKLAREINREQTNSAEKEKTKNFILKWIGVATELREKGITEKVLSCFALKADGDVLKPKSSSSVPADDDIDDLIANSSKSQGWAAYVFNENKAAVISIRTNTATGTGFIVSNNGFVLTNEHVLVNKDTKEYESNVEMSFADSKDAHRLQVIALDRDSDVALCRFDLGQTPIFSVVKRIKNYSQTKQGADILVIGNGFSMGLAPFTGTIRYVREERTGNLVYTAPSNPGDSGGPVFNRAGECIGINKSIIKSVTVGGNQIVEASGLTNATPMDRIEDLLNEWSKQFGLTL